MTTKNEIFAALTALIVLGVCAYALLQMRAGIPYAGVSATSTAAVSQPPPFTPAIKAQLAASHGFQYLVSYTGKGFEPMSVTVKKGDTVRFTNNSNEDLWIASAGTPGGSVYPAGVGNECGQSAFDSCRSMKHGEFWEFTFTEVGTWGYKNNADTKMAGVVMVK